jgi:hypothetical protein
MNFVVGDHIRIDAEYPFDRMLQNRKGIVIELPNNIHPDNYIIQLDSGIFGGPGQGNQIVQVVDGWLINADYY